MLEAEGSKDGCSPCIRGLTAAGNYINDNWLLFPVHTGINRTENRHCKNHGQCQDPDH